MKEVSHINNGQENRSAANHMTGKNGISAIPPGHTPVQLAEASDKEEETIQKAEKPNNTGLPDNLKAGLENLSGYAMDDVKVHYNSSKPAQLEAHAYAQGTDIHLASGQEKHLPHEAWHVVQQKQGRVKPTLQLKNKVNINDDTGLENEADLMGAKANQPASIQKQPDSTKKSTSIEMQTAQLTRQSKGIVYATSDEDAVEWLKENISDWDELPEEDREMAMDIAQDKTQGVQVAKNMLAGADFEKEVKKRQEKREGDIKDDFETFDETFNDDLANNVFKAMKNAFVGGNKNVSIAGDYSQTQVDDAIAAFRLMLEDGNLTDDLTNFHFYRRQNKAEAGKGRVGDTLATREIQANFIGSWKGSKINVHVDING